MTDQATARIDGHGTTEAGNPLIELGMPAATMTLASMDQGARFRSSSGSGPQDGRASHRAMCRAAERCGTPQRLGLLRSGRGRPLRQLFRRNRPKLQRCDLATALHPLASGDVVDMVLDSRVAEPQATRDLLVRKPLGSPGRQSPARGGLAPFLSSASAVRSLQPADRGATEMRGEQTSSPRIARITALARILGGGILGDIAGDASLRARLDIAFDLGRQPRRRREAPRRSNEPASAGGGFHRHLDRGAARLVEPLRSPVAATESDPIPTRSNLQWRDRLAESPSRYSLTSLAMYSRIVAAGSPLSSSFGGYFRLTGSVRSLHGHRSLAARMASSTRRFKGQRWFVSGCGSA